ncbi:hypothetical protein JHK85_008463 [Glycine max]|nr:hypothetical protein JHK85_008463 [Glycine max]
MDKLLARTSPLLPPLYPFPFLCDHAPLLTLGCGLSYWLPYILRYVKDDKLTIPSLGTIVSAYGCWRFFNKPVIQNGAKAEFLRRDVEETISTNLITSNKLESRYVEEDFQQRAGFWGFVMQTIYQIMWFQVIVSSRA